MGKVFKASQEEFKTSTKVPHYIFFLFLITMVVIKTQQTKLEN